MSDENNITAEVDFLTISLSPEDSIAREISEPLMFQDLGDDDTPQIKKENIEIRIGKSPIVFSLRDLYEKSHKKLPPDFAVFEEFRIWVIKYVVSVVKERGWRDIKQLTLEVSFPDKPKISTLQVFPNTRFIKKFEIDGKLEWMFDVGLTVAGEVSPPEALAEIISQTNFVSFDGGAKAGIKLSNKASIIGNINFSVVTPIVEATGTAGDYCRWDFHKESVPMVGDHQMMQILMVGNKVNELKLKERISTLTTYIKYFPDTRRSQWIELEAKLSENLK